MAAIRICSIDGCGKKHYGKDLCQAHYMRLWKKGDAMAAVRTPPGSVDKFITEVAMTYEGDECLIWPFARYPDGRGMFVRDGKSVIASRYICELAHGSPPTPLHHAAHNCGKGNDGCIAPKHLRWATRLENEKDKIEHGTLLNGERCGAARLKDSDISKIKEMLRRGVAQPEIAAAFGVSQSAISLINVGKTWRHIE